MAYKPILFNTDMVKAILEGRKTQTRRLMKPQPLFYTGRKYIFADEECPKKWEDCPNIIATYQYQPGDILWVRETWSHDGDEYRYKADDEMPDGWHTTAWRPSIHMPKEAARIFLRVKDVRIERLQDITPSDIDAEGCKEWGYSVKTGELLPSSPTRFKIVWDKTIKPADLKRFGWSANPWVWVIEFERCEKPEGWCIE